jgi:hypothetical protein
MDSIIAFLNQPVILTLLSLTVGGYLLSLLSDRRARKDKTRDKSIDLLTDIGNDINIVTGRIYGHLRAQNMKVMRNHVLMDGMGKLFTMRLGIRVRSQAYFNSERFYRQYDIIVWELRQLVDFMETLTDEYNIEQVVTTVQARKRILGDKWPLDDEWTTSKGEQPFRELLSWTDMIVNRTSHMLSTYLKSALK